MIDMRILSIETSCDDTALSVVELVDDKIPSFRVIQNLVSSQTEIHRQWGGIHPSLARREHQKNLPILLKTILKKGSQIVKEERVRDLLKREDKMIEPLLELLEETEKPEIDLIALTIGPGLDPSLWTGVNFAKALALQWDVPVVPVNHIEAHLYISLFSFKDPLLEFCASKDDFPAIGLIVSGGHTQLILMKSPKDYQIIGETRDDAAGECFDKTARIIGLGYPGGPEISIAAKKSRGTTSPLPRPMIDQKNYDFSFSGLKTAVLYRYKKESNINIENEAKEIQQAIIDILVTKTVAASKEFGARSIIGGGGVISNDLLRAELSQRSDVKTFFPAKEGRTDNALMIAVTGYRDREKAVDFDKIEAISNLRI